MAFGPSVHAPPDASSAAWIEPRLGAFGTVGGLVPSGYDGCLVLDHRAHEAPGYEGVSRLFGELAPVLGPHTGTQDACWFAIWEGYGFTTRATLWLADPHLFDPVVIERERRRLEAQDALTNASIGAALDELPTFELPHRRYYLLHGPLDAVSRIQSPDASGPQPPDLWWPQDQAWFVAGDVDLDWCYVAGSADLLEEVRRALPGRTHEVDRTQTNLEAAP